MGGGAVYHDNRVRVDKEGRDDLRPSGRNSAGETC
jgi:hypothetical protein